MIGYYSSTLNGGTASIVVENNYGYGLEIPDTGQEVLMAEPGVTRIDVTGGVGTGVCSVVWDQEIISPSTILKLSTGTGIIYFVEPEYLDANNDGVHSSDETAWYMTGLDFLSGAVEFRTFLGTGKQWNVNYAAISIGPDGKAYFGTIRGLVSVEDGP